MLIITSLYDMQLASKYANIVVLNEMSDIYSFEVLLLEAMTGRDSTDYGRPADEFVPISICFPYINMYWHPTISNFLRTWQVKLVEWLRMMVGSNRTEDVVDPDPDIKPASRALKHPLLVAKRCVDLDSVKLAQVESSCSDAW